MKNSSFAFTLLLSFVVSVLFLTALPRTMARSNAAPDKDKLTVQEIILKHLDSIAPADVRSKTTTRTLIGTCVFAAQLPAGGTSTTDGAAVLASDGGKILLAAKFNSPTYPSEQLAFDGKKVSAGYVKPGLHSTLGDFLLARSFTFKEGLIGGSLSSAWPFWDLTSHNARLELGGTRKVSGREAYVINYSPKKGSDLAVKILIDAENFRHLRTEYVQVVAAGLSRTIDGAYQRRETRYEMREDFSDFRVEQGLTLPHKYKLEIMIDVQEGTTIQNWEYTFDKFTFNEKLDASAFNLDSQPK